MITKINQSLDKKIIMHSNEDMNDTIEFIEVQDVKSSLSNLKKRLKEEIYKRDLNNFMGYCYSIQDINEGKGIILSLWIDKLFNEEIGKRLLEDEK